jgi:glycine/D-amino acid oxidase-like deaminating enzyme
MADINHEPYWWEAAAPVATPTTPVATTADVVIVGSGYTGMSAAITLARAGRSVVVFDRMKLGEGASTRNGGITSGNLRPSLAELEKSFGDARAHAIIAEAKEAREDLYRFIADEKLQCDFSPSGRFTGAAEPGDYDSLAREADVLKTKFGIDAYAVSRSEQREFIGTDYYFGGNVRMDIGGLHPAKFWSELLRLARDAGAVIHASTRVEGVQRSGARMEVTTDRGKVTCGNVLMATNGYADGADPWLRRRIVPVRSRIIATEPLSSNLMKALMPRATMYSDTRALSYYYRPSPDGTRILFGGRDGTISGQPTWPTDHLKDVLAGLFPELGGVRLTHSWHGNVAMHRDMVPRVFKRDGVHYATGYCGSGVVWARWLGRKAALQMLGEPAGSTAFDFRPPRAVPLFSGKPWFMPAVFAWLGMKDRIKARKAAAS